jgi:hypothetical protein
VIVIARPVSIYAEHVSVLDNPTHPYSIALKDTVLPPDPAQVSAIISRSSIVDELTPPASVRPALALQRGSSS